MPIVRERRRQTTLSIAPVGGRVYGGRKKPKTPQELAEEQAAQARVDRADELKWRERKRRDEAERARQHESSERAKSREAQIDLALIAKTGKYRAGGAGAGGGSPPAAAKPPGLTPEQLRMQQRINLVKQKEAQDRAAYLKKPTGSYDITTPWGDRWQGDMGQSLSPAEQARRTQGAQPAFDAARREMAQAQQKDNLLEAAGLGYLRGYHGDSRTLAGETPEGTIGRAIGRGQMQAPGEDITGMQDRRRALELQRNSEMFLRSGAGGPEMRAQAGLEAGGGGLGAIPPQYQGLEQLGQPGMSPEQAALLRMTLRGQAPPQQQPMPPMEPPMYHLGAEGRPPDLDANRAAMLWRQQMEAGQVQPMPEEDFYAKMQALTPLPVSGGAGGGPAFVGPGDPMQDLARRESEMRLRLGEQQLQAPQKPGTEQYQAGIQAAAQQFGNLPTTFMNTGEWASLVTTSDAMEAEASAQDIARRIAQYPDPRTARAAIQATQWYSDLKKSRQVAQQRLYAGRAGQTVPQVARYIAALDQIIAAVEGGG